MCWYASWHALYVQKLGLLYFTWHIRILIYEPMPSSHRGLHAMDHWNMLCYLIMSVKLEKLFKIRQKCMFYSESTLNPCFKLFPHVSTNTGPTSNSRTANLDGFTMSTWILCHGSLFICFICFYVWVNCGVSLFGFL